MDEVFISSLVEVITAGVVEHCAMEGCEDFSAAHIIEQRIVTNCATVWYLTLQGEMLATETAGVDDNLLPALAEWMSKRSKFTISYLTLTTNYSRPNTEQLCVSSGLSSGDVPGLPVDLQVFYPAVVWQPPVDPNGVIINCHLTFTRDRQSSTVTTTGDQTYYIIRTQDIPGSSGQFTVKVRGRNSAGRGDPISTSAVPGEECPTPTPIQCPTVTCPICPTRPPVVRPGTVRNARAINCTILWEPPQNDGGEIEEYRVRIYAGRTYGSAPRLQKTVLRAFNTWLTPAEDMPTERPVFAMVKAKNSAGLSAQWSAPVLVATTTDCP